MLTKEVGFLVRIELMSYSFHGGGGAQMIMCVHPITSAKLEVPWGPG